MSLFKTNWLTNLKKNVMSEAYAQWLLVSLVLLAIVLHFILQYTSAVSNSPLSLHNIPLLFIIVVAGIPLIVEIFQKLIQRDFGADFLAVIAFITGVWLEEYLASVLIILMLTGGQVLEAYAMRKASSALQALANRMPATANRKQGDQIEEVALHNIAIGDDIVVFPHETAPVDGIVIEGNGGMDESYLTGEPYEVSKAPGSSVLSGAINGEAVLVIRAEKTATDSRYAQIMKVMQDAEQKRPQMRRLGDQIGALFAPLALILAGVAWYITGDSTRFLAVLVVATPCPLLIAIPITLISAISMAARRGVIIKDPTALELLPTCRTAIFDKTGTLTYGKPDLTEIITAEGIDEKTILQQTASLERYSKHPLASSIQQTATKRKLAMLKVESVSEKPGQGLSGIIAGNEIKVTSRKKLLQTSPDLEAMLPPTAAGLECIILLNGVYAATFRFRDAPRADGKSFISHLTPSHQFKKIMLVSGDRESEVSYLATLLGIKETLSSQSPEEKVEVVRKQTALAPTLFIGDGINDAPALACATVGIAFGQHSSVTAEAAGVVIMENSLIKVDELIHISAAMRRIMLQSALGGMFLSLVAMGFAAAGFITPVMGALLQEVIDVIAIVNALRLSLESNIEIDFNVAKSG